MTIPLLWVPPTGPSPDACGSLFARVRLLVVVRSSKRVTGLVLEWEVEVEVGARLALLLLSWLDFLLLWGLFCRLAFCRPMLWSSPLAARVELLDALPLV